LLNHRVVATYQVSKILMSYSGDTPLIDSHPNIVTGRFSMTFRPLQDRVLIRRIEQEAKTAGGIIIPDTAKEKPMEGSTARSCWS
jgi:hypothetical protein